MERIKLFVEHWRGPTQLDWVIIIAYIIISFLIGVYYARRGRRSTRDYFISGGGVPWWLLGTSLVATTFAADTPLALSGWVVTKGISQNWFWWCQVPITLAGVFFFARLWRRTNVITDMEFVYLRYSGGSANVLRGFKAFYLAIPYGCLVMGWVNKAMAKIIALTFPKLPTIPVVDDFIKWLYMHTPVSSGLPEKVRSLILNGSLDPFQLYDKLNLAGKARFLKMAYAQNLDSEKVFATAGITENLESLQAQFGIEPFSLISGVAQYVSGINELKILLFLFSVTVIYTTISGLWAVLVTDFFQFFIAMAGCIYLAVVAVHHFGGMEKLLHQLSEIYTQQKALGMIAIAPVKEAGGLGLMPLKHFILFILVSWWAVGFTDGGSYFAQRMLSAKNERHAALGYLWFAVAHFALRMWPWLVVGIAAAVMFPFKTDPITGFVPDAEWAEDGYIKVMLSLLGPGLIGFLLVAFFAAYMSTIATQVNIAASYLLNDLYRPFLVKNKPEKHYVRASTVATLVISLIGIIASLYITSIASAWFLLAALNSGIGIIYLLRWYWWRINAWSEITCIAALFYFAWILYEYGPKINLSLPYPENLLFSIPFAVGLSMAITAVTQPVDKDKLIEFYKRVQPGGPGWKPIAELVPEIKPRSPLTWTNLKAYIYGVAAIYCFLFGFGKTILGNGLYPTPVIGNTTFSIVFLIAGIYLLWKSIVKTKVSAGDVGCVIQFIIAMLLLTISLAKLIWKPDFLIDLSLYNQTYGILLLIVGTYLGYLVAMSFAPKKWEA